MMQVLVSFLGLVVALSLILVPSRDAHATQSLEQCTVLECVNGEVFCSPGGTDMEDPNEPKALKCQVTVVDFSCSEVIECGRRVPAMSVVGLSGLGLAMIAAGAAVLRLRRRNP